MLPFDDKKTKSLGGGSSDDLMGAGKKSAVKRLMEALQSNDLDQAVDALETFMELCEDD